MSIYIGVASEVNVGIPADQCHRSDGPWWYFCGQERVAGACEQDGGNVNKAGNV